MKRKLLISLAVLAVLAGYLAGVRWLVTALNVQGRGAWILGLGLALLGVLVAVVALLYLLRKPAPPPPPKDAVVEELQRSLVAAERKLAAAKVAPSGALGKLPVVLLLGAPGSTKTSSVVRSGLDAELLIGDVFRDDAVVATRGVNLWFGRGTLFVEAGRDIADEPGRWRWFLRRLQPARLKGALSSGQQAPRVAVVCYSCEALAAAGAVDAANAAARSLRDRLGQLSQAFGVRLPVYVVFSKADRIPGFAEYVQNFTRDEVRAVVGATLPLASRGDGASHADRESRRLHEAWSRIFSGLAARRVDVLARETVADRKPAAYELPREVRKLAPAAVQFLIELCRPTELGLGPVLRGFYLTGVRAVVSTDGAMAIPSLAPAREAQPVAATSVFRPVAGAPVAAPTPAAPGGRKKPEWVFLPGLFPDVVLADSVAMGATRGGARISALRRTLAAAGIGLAAALAVAFTVSFGLNRRLQRSVGVAAASVAAIPRETVGIPRTDALARLDSLREEITTLSEYYHEGAPFWYGLGLYSGDRLYGPARSLYFDRFARLLYDSTRAGLQRALTSVAAPNADVPYDSAYRLLRAYLITTDAPEHSTPEFLGPALVNAWPQGTAVDSADRELARRQFEFFGRELPYGNPYSDRGATPLIQAARDVLKKSSGITSIYISMITEAARRGKPVRLTTRGGGVVNPAEVPAQFTQGAWSFFVDTALGRDLRRFLQGEPWVTGGVASPPGDSATLARELRAQYVSDYVDAWRRYVKSASIAGFGSAQDAAQKLEALAGPTSPLLGMLLSVSENAAVDSVDIRTRLQPVEVVMPVTNRDTYVGGANQEYMDKVGALAIAMRQVASVPNGADPSAALQQATTAIGDLRGAARKLSGQFAREPEEDLKLARLLVAPAERVEALINFEFEKQKRAGAAKSVNEALVAFCAQVRPVLEKKPFGGAEASVTATELADLFKPTGQIAQFFEQSLKGVVLVKSGGAYRQAPGGPPPSSDLLRFMTWAQRVTDALFPAGSPEPRAMFTFRPELTESIPILTMTFGDTTMQFARGGERTVTTAWRFREKGAVSFARTGLGTVSENGAWAPFHMYRDARPSAQPGTRTYDIVLGQGRGRATLEMSIGGGLGDPEFFKGPGCPSQAVR